MRLAGHEARAARHHPLCGTDYSDRVSDEIAVALLDFVKDRPEAAELLRDRTFARTLH